MNINNTTIANLWSTTSEPLPEMAEETSWLEAFRDWYHPAHVPFVIAICLFGVFANIINIVVLTRPAMMKNPTNTILLGLSVAQLLLVINFLSYTAYSQVSE